MRIGLKLRNGENVDGLEIRELAVTAEQLELDSVWIDAHVVVPAQIASRFGLNSTGRPPFGFRAPFADPFVTLAFVAGATRRIRVGTAVIPYMSTHVLSLAKQAATLDLMSNGRLELGLGAGWLAEEGLALGHLVDHPTARMAEAIDILRVAWRDGQVEWRGEYHAVPLVGIEPRPPQGSQLPIWIGGAGPAALRVAIAKRAGIVLSNPGVDTIAAARRAFHAAGCVARVAALIPLASVRQPASLAELEANGLDLAILTSPLGSAQLVAELGRLLAGHPSTHTG